MFGKTNSVVAAGGGDVVQAVNNMGTAVKGGDKVWLNRHIFDSVAQANAGGSTGSNIYTFNFGNKFYCHKSNILYRADFKDNTWRLANLGEVPDATVRSIQFRKALVWEYVTDTRSIIFRNTGDFTVVAGIAVSGDMAVIDRKICTFNPETGEVETTGDVVNPASKVKTSFALKFGNVLFVGVENYNYYFYDITDIQAPVLLKAGAFSGSETVVYATGLAVGDYLIARNSIYANEMSKDVLHIYKIAEGYVLEIAADLPKGLEDMVGRGARISYNNNTGVLCVGTGSKLAFYQFFEGAFHVLDITLPTLPTIKNNYFYLGRLNDNMSILTIQAVSGGSYSYYDMWLYRLSAFNGQWYAEPYADSSSASFTGFAVSEAENDAAVLVKTVMPEALALTVEVENDEAKIDVKGAK